MNLDEVLDRFAGVRRNGTGAMAKCPVHDDSTASLSLSDGDKGVVVHCHAGCATVDVLAAVGLRTADLFTSSRADAPRAPARPIEYVYRDADGLPYNRVVRRDGKRFAQFRRDGDQWVAGLGDHRPIPYRFDELVAAVEHRSPVWICEGEKDVDTLVRRGVVATCNPMGAGKWSKVADLAELHLAGAEVHIAVDRDQPGYRHGLDVFRSVSKVAGSVTIHEPAKGKDITDHLVTHQLDLDELEELSVDQLEQLAADTRTELEDGTELDDPFHVIDWSTFWNEADDEEDRWLLDPVLPRGRGVALYAGAKVGKSDLMLWLVLRLVTGRDLHGDAMHPVDVLYLDFEMTVADVRDRLEDFGVDPDVDLTHLHYASLPTLPALDTPEGGLVVLSKAVQVGAELVVVDTTGRAVVGAENDADTFRDFYKHTGLGLKASGIGFARLDHAGKDPTRGQRGSSAKAEDVDVVLELTRTDEGAALRSTHRRMNWYPALTHLKRTEDDVTGQVTYTPSATMWPAGTREVADLLDQLEVPVDASTRRAASVLKAHGQGRQRVVVNAAVRFRKGPHYAR